MAFAPNSEVGTGRILGSFINKETNVLFEYGETQPDEDFVWGEYTTKLWVGPNEEFRWADVLKTVAYVVVDEAADGTPVVEKWAIKRNVTYNRTAI